MPNWAFTNYLATGDMKQVEKLHNTMLELESMKAPGLHENGFGKTWLGNLVIKLGGDWEKVYCRGSWSDLYIDNECMMFSVESAWSEPNEVRHLIEEKFPGIKLYYQCEESGMGIYQTNDDTGQYFPAAYYLWVEDEDSDYYDSLEEVITVVEKITGSKHLKTLDACHKALQSYSQKHSDCGYTLEPFKVVDD